MEILSYKDLEVWRRSMEVVSLIYKLTAQFPVEEKFGLVTQMRRCAVSIPSNIAEGKARGTRKDYRQFLIVAFGSGAELETQLLIAKQLNYASPEILKITNARLDEIMKMLNALIAKLAIPKT